MRGTKSGVGRTGRGWMGKQDKGAHDCPSYASSKTGFMGDKPAKNPVNTALQPITVLLREQVRRRSAPQFAELK